MPPAIQKPLLPLRRDGGPTSPASGLPTRRPGSQHTSPAKEILTAVERGNPGGALCAAAAACLRSPLLLLAAVVLLLGAAALASWLLPQQPLPAMLAHISYRERSPRQRAFFEELTQKEQHIIGAAAAPPPPRVARQHSQQHEAAASLDALALPRQTPGHAAQQQRQQQQQQQQQQLQQQDGQQLDNVQRARRAQPGAASANDAEPLFDIHKIAGVPQLFGAVRSEEHEQH
ncbi:hypothetical protein ABPG75_001476 [Micractinium tetrahymenae]